jgi:hypothetical protein
METTLPRLTDYWDEQTRTIDRQAMALAEHDAAGREAAAKDLQAA